MKTKCVPVYTSNILIQNGFDNLKLVRVRYSDQPLIEQRCKLVSVYSFVNFSYIFCYEQKPSNIYIAVKYPKAGPKKGTIKISPNKPLQSLFINVAASPKIHVPVTSAIICFNHNPCYTA